MDQGHPGYRRARGIKSTAMRRGTPPPEPALPVASPDRGFVFRAAADTPKGVVERRNKEIVVPANSLQSGREDSSTAASASIA